MTADGLVVAIDGPSGAGKSTVARMLARRLGFAYLDTGAMYRAVALGALRRGIGLDDGPALERYCSGIDLDLKTEGEEQRVLLEGEDVSADIRTPEISLASSAVSAVPQVRSAMVQLQRRVARGGGLVAEGRDMGTVVFPTTPAKFFLDASLSERARRRWLELKGRGTPQPLEQVMEEMERRDRNDARRSHSPLVRAEDAVYIDSAGMPVEAVVETMARRVGQLEVQGG